MVLPEQEESEMTLVEAIKKAEEFRGAEVGVVKDCNDRWAFAFKEDEE